MLRKQAIFFFDLTGQHSWAFDSTTCLFPFVRDIEKRAFLFGASSLLKMTFQLRSNSTDALVQLNNLAGACLMLQNFVVVVGNQEGASYILPVDFDHSGCQ